MIVSFLTIPFCSFQNTYKTAWSKRDPTCEFTHIISHNSPSCKKKAYIFTNFGETNNSLPFFLSVYPKFRKAAKTPANAENPHKTATFWHFANAKSRSKQKTSSCFDRLFIAPICTYGIKFLYPAQLLLPRLSGVSCKFTTYFISSSVSFNISGAIRSRSFFRVLLYKG